MQAKWVLKICVLDALKHTDSQKNEWRVTITILRQYLTNNDNESDTLEDVGLEEDDTVEDIMESTTSENENLAR